MTVKKDELQMDASTTVFFERELESMRKNSYDVKKIPLKSRTAIPVNFQDHEGAQVISYRQYDTFGMAKIISNYADDLPIVDVSGKEFFSPVKTLGVAFMYSVQEVRAAAKSKLPLTQKRSEAARRAVAEAENRYAIIGDPSTGLPGLLTNPNIPRVGVAANGSGETQWENKTAQEILADLSACINTPSNLTGGTESAKDLLISNRKYNFMKNAYTDDRGEYSVLAVFKKNNPEIRQIIPMSELDGAGYNGTDVMVAYDRDIRNLEMAIPMEYLVHAPQQNNLAYKVPVEENFGGVIVFYPFSLCISEGL